ncbi:hypothetical protein SeLEV6574_g01324 [Synchytrium endobioticum]|uniref:Uncharacterized protein n=1 Tax=Synchytrium endobioticum TaxID=286115 RepID=A0A507DFL0_9FUNG|nr:hypothetical protein SeLEV6574_g01324 [Synchytrium endobioticum]
MTFTLDRIRLGAQIKPQKRLKATPCALELSALLTCWRAAMSSATSGSQGTLNAIQSCSEASTALLKCSHTQNATRGRGTASLSEMNTLLRQVKKGKRL